MVPAPFVELVALLYYVCFCLLAGLTLFIAIRGRGRTSARSRLRRTFCLLALFLLLWQLTLFLEVRLVVPAVQLWLGRANFAAVVFVTYFALRFVQEVPPKVAHPSASLLRWLCVETVLLALIAVFTPFITRTERVEAGHAITIFGLLFPLYLLHVLVYLGAALVLAFRHRRRARKPALRGQLLLIGLGMLVTGGISLVTNVLLPYGLDNFRFCDVGTLSTIFFVLAIAYATFLHGLFDLRLLLRDTLVYGLLLTFVLGAYSSAVFLVTQYLTSGTNTLKQFAVFLIAFSFDPLRRLIELKADRLLFGTREGREEPRKRRSRRGR